MKKNVEKIFWFIIENGVTILTIFFASYVIAIAQTSKLSTEVLLQWILAILGLIAISGLIERVRKLKKIEDTGNETLKAIKNKFSNKPKSEDYFMKRLPPLEPYLLKAKDIRLSGYSLQRTIRENIHILSKRLKEGATVKILLVDLEKKKEKNRSNHGSMVTMQSIEWLNQQSENKGTIELKFVKEDLHYNILAIDPNEESGIMFVEFFPQRWVTEGRPRVELTQGRDAYWFKYFRDQYDSIWNDYEIEKIQDESDN
jgi:hypothetical protein